MIWIALASLLISFLLWCDRQRFRAQAQESSQKLHELSDNIAASILVRDQSGKLVYCSPFTEVLTGYALSQIQSGEHDFFESIVHEEDRERYQRALRVCQAGESFQFRYRFFHKTGIEMWAETRTVPLMGADGVPHSSLSITFDVTGTVRYQRLVEERNRDLQDFTYMISHDLKAPLFTLKGMLQVLKEELPAAAASQPIQHMDLALHRLEALVAGVLDYSRINAQDATPSEIDLAQVLDEVRVDLSAEIQKINATVKVPPQLPRVRGEHLWLYQVFSNLIQNAIKYRDPARTPHIEVRQSASKNRRMLQLEIEDNGLGISAEYIDLIFRPFQRAHRGQVEGTGIGLACVKKIVEKLGGEVSVTSQVGEGSTFRISLPLAPPEGV
jgi:PAS domain S-box-containing protein